MGVKNKSKDDSKLNGRPQLHVCTKSATDLLGEHPLEIRILPTKIYISLLF